MLKGQKLEDSWFTKAKRSNNVWHQKAEPKIIISSGLIIYLHFYFPNIFWQNHYHIITDRSCTPCVNKVVLFLEKYKLLFIEKKKRKKGNHRWGECPLLLLSLGRVLGHKGPTESVFFVWKAAWRKILTCENFRRKSGEGVDHLLNQCTEAYQLWYFVFRSFGYLQGLTSECERTFVWLEDMVG